MTKGERIRLARTEKGWTQKTLGEKAGIAEPTIRRYELGKLNPKYETVSKIADSLGVDVEWLWSGNADNNPDVFYPNGRFGATRKFDLQMFAAEPDQVTTSEEAEAEIRFSLSKLNVMGKRVAVERVQELTEIPKYQKDKEDEPDND